MSVPDWVVYPDEEWPVLSLAEAGFRQQQLTDIIEQHKPAPTQFWGERHEPEEYAAVLTRGGYLVRTWGRSRDYRWQTASVGKAFVLALLGLAVEQLGLNPDEPVWRTWTGIGELSHSHKHLDNEIHSGVTWRHLAEHSAGFALENANHWRRGMIPQEDWIRDKWTGNAMYDMYSLRPPGERFYSSAGYVRLGQALTVLWGMDLKRVLDQELFGKIGIKPDNWHWLSLAEVYQTYDLYPASPGYGHFVDPPFEIRGNVIRGAPGWVSMSAEDLARFGLLVATGGEWKGEKLLGADWLISKSGGNESTMVGDRTTFVAGSRIATTNLPDFLWVPDFQEYRFPQELIEPDVVPGRASRVP